MTRSFFPILAPVLATTVLVPAGHAQDAKPELPKAVETALSAERRAPGPTLRVQVVISRFQGEKKVASLPYALSVTAEGRPVRMRMGVDTPVAVATAAAEGARPAMTSLQYRNVGTNIDCSARNAGDGRYQLMLSIESSSAYLGGQLADANATGGPLFRRFDATLDPVLRDGQTVQTVASTDPVTGEVVKIDVSLSVVK
jgi:hypothetical protein